MALIEPEWGERPREPRAPERDYWLLSEATDRWYDFATRIGHYLFPDGRRHSVPEHTLIAGKGDLSDIHVRKMGVPAATGTLKNSWKPYTTAAGTTGNVVFKAGSTWATASEMRSMDEMGAVVDTVDVEAAAKSLTSLMAKMESARTPRQWLDFRVSEIAEQGRL